MMMKKMTFEEFRDRFFGATKVGPGKDGEPSIYVISKEAQKLYDEIHADTEPAPKPRMSREQFKSRIWQIETMSRYGQSTTVEINDLYDDLHAEEPAGESKELAMLKELAIMSRRRLGLNFFEMDADRPANKDINFHWIEKSISDKPDKDDPADNEPADTKEELSRPTIVNDAIREERAKMAQAIKAIHCHSSSIMNPSPMNEALKLMSSPDFDLMEPHQVIMGIFGKDVK
jgi:hypothetical protein